MRDINKRIGCHQFFVKMLAKSFRLSQTMKKRCVLLCAAAIDLKSIHPTQGHPVNRPAGVLG